MTEHSHIRGARSQDVANHGLEHRAEALFLLRQELDASREIGASPNDVEVLANSVFDLEVELGIRKPPTFEESFDLRRELLDPTTSLERLREIKRISDDLLPPQ